MRHGPCPRMIGSAERWRQHLAPVPTKPKTLVPAEPETLQRHTFERLLRVAETRNSFTPLNCSCQRRCGFTPLNCCFEQQRRGGRAEPVVEYIIPAPAESHVALVPVAERTCSVLCCSRTLRSCLRRTQRVPHVYIAPGPAVPYGAPAPAEEYIAPSPAVSYAAPAVFMSTLRMRMQGTPHLRLGVRSTNIYHGEHRSVSRSVLRCSCACG